MWVPDNSYLSGTILDVSFAVFFLLLTLYRLDLKRRRGI